MKEVPKVFPWVEERAKCSIVGVFIALAVRVKSDVESMTGLHLQPKHLFAFTAPSEKTFLVEKQIKVGGMVAPGGVVVFEHDETKITVSDGLKYNVLFEATPAIGEDGPCRLDVNGVVLELWQVSRKALEPLFFGS